MDYLTERILSIFGILFFIGIALALSEYRKKVAWRLVGWGMGLQFVFAVLILKTGPGKHLFDLAKEFFDKLIEFSNAGAIFLFGTLVTDLNIGAVMAFHALPIIVFVSALAGIFFHLGIIQKFVSATAWIMQRSLNTSGAESLAAALFIFLGIESTTAIPVYIRKMTRSEIFTLMTAFMATIAGSVMGVYVAFGASAGHLLAASIMSAPAAITIAKIMIPETGEPLTRGSVTFKPQIGSSNVIDAAANGASEGMKLALNIGAMLIAFVGLITMLNFILNWIAGITFTQLLGYVFLPFAYLLGIPFADASSVSHLLGMKTVLNEFLAYQEMQTLITQGKLSPRAVTITTYALCGFANFGSIAILIGGLGGIDPHRRGEVAALGIKALIAGTLAAFMTAGLAGILV